MLVLIGAATFAVTATAVLMLAEEGRLSLDDLVTDYISGFAGNGNVTIANLLSHTVGYREMPELRAPHTSLREWVEDWAATAPTGASGEVLYSDFNYIVEAGSGTPIDVYTEERIIGPLRLSAGGGVASVLSTQVSLDELSRTQDLDVTVT